MIAVICVLAVLGLGANCFEQMPTRQEIEISINRTIDEVERMVKENPNLPRLSRSEIVDILLNITAKDMDGYKEHVEKVRKDYQRALMVVLPYNSKDSKNENISDLFTKAPMVLELPDASTSSYPIKGESIKTTVKSLDNLINSSTKKSEDSIGESANYYKNHRDTYTEVNTQKPTEETLRKLFKSDDKMEASPEKFTFDLDTFETTKNEEAANGQQFFEGISKNRNTPPNKSKLEIVYSTSVTQNPTTKIRETNKIDLQEFRPTMPPTKSTQNIITSDQWRYNAPPSPTTSKPQRSSPNSIKSQKKATDSFFVPTIMTEPGEKAIESSATIKPEVSTSISVVYRKKNQNSQLDMKNLRIMNENEKAAPVYVTPMSSPTATKLSASFRIAKTPEVTKAPMQMREEVQDLLASIGLRPMNGKIKGETGGKNTDQSKKIFGENFQIPETNNAVYGQTSGLTSVGAEAPSISSQNTFENNPQDVKKGLDNLSPDVQLLFQRFGLETSVGEHEKPLRTTTTEKPRPTMGKNNFWNNFKPLPTSEVKDEGMKDFLAKFGLGLKDNRNDKALKARKSTEDEEPPSLIDAVPGNMKQILENIGLITKSQKPVTTIKLEKNIESTSAPKLHVFKPHETSFDNEKQRKKINELLDMVKKVQEGKLDVREVQIAAKELVETAKSLQSGPDPLSLEEILKIYNDDVKNEIKRQQDPKELFEIATSENPETSLTTSTSTSSSLDAEVASSDDTTSSPVSMDSAAVPLDVSSSETSTDGKSSGTIVETATTESTLTTASSVDLDALADSFGGSTSAPDPVLPTRRRTGLYFLVDWNTFLEVGEEEKDKVNLRFQPKVGDRTRFISVTVP